MLTLAELAFRSFLDWSSAPSTEFRWKRRRVIAEWQSMPLRDRGLICWLLGSNYERDRAHPQLLIALEVHHRALVAGLAKNGPEALAWANYEEEEAMETYSVDRFGKLVSVAYRPRDKYSEAEELRAKLIQAREWRRRIGETLPLVIRRGEVLRE